MTDPVDIEALRAELTALLDQPIFDDHNPMDWSSRVYRFLRDRAKPALDEVSALRAAEDKWLETSDRFIEQVLALTKRAETAEAQVAALEVKNAELERSNTTVARLRDAADWQDRMVAITAERDALRLDAQKSYAVAARAASLQAAVDRANRLADECEARVEGASFNGITSVRQWWVPIPDLRTALSVPSGDCASEEPRGTLVAYPDVITVELVDPAAVPVLPEEG